LESAQVLAIIVLAAGKGTRMNSDLPKVLHRLSGVPLIHHVLNAAEQLHPDRTVVVVGHRRSEVMASLTGRKAEFAVQDPQLGTGHAVQQAVPILNGYSGEVVVLSGDVPLLRAKTLKALLSKHQSAKATATVLSTVAPDPTAYGRIVRDTSGVFIKIVEEREANEQEKKVREINSGVYCFDATMLFRGLGEIRADNSKGGYYLTDVIAVLRQAGEIVQAVDLADYREVRGINTVAELEDAEGTAQALIADRTT
jgi:UDP-N-acetylglucosamine diphosphorylase/glucosamine-1-phosphate N-acetyltransferase